MSRSLFLATLIIASSICFSLCSGSTSDSFTFLVIGDWGEVNSHQKDVANAMTSLIASSTRQQGVLRGSKHTSDQSDGLATPPGFIISVGDNFYENGVSSVMDPQWKTTFFDVYNSPELALPWYSCIGNHDALGNVTAQVAYTHYNRAPDQRWRMPDEYYTVSWDIAKGQSLQLVVLNTIPLAPTTSFGLHGEQILRTGSTRDADEQWDWIESTLAASKATYLFVVGHYPVYSGGANGNTPELHDNLKPLLEKYGVNAYFSGHDHDLQVLESSGVYYIVSGSGSKKSNVANIKQTLYADSAHGFASVTIDLESRTFSSTLYNHAGSTLYTLPAVATNRS